MSRWTASEKRKPDPPVVPPQRRDKDKDKFTTERLTPTMHRPGMDPNNVQMTDILCDFCLSPWNEKSIFIEGHQGSVICGKCLTIAYAEVVNQQQNSAPAGYKCTMCLEHREDNAWQSPLRSSDDDEATATICQRCIELAAEAIDKDPDSDWSPPKS